ncbi:unnamed protein product [Ectocarpus sp. 8 AP-2014]
MELGFCPKGNILFDGGTKLYVAYVGRTTARDTIAYRCGLIFLPLALSYCVFFFFVPLLVRCTSLARQALVFANEFGFDFCFLGSSSLRSTGFVVLKGKRTVASGLLCREVGGNPPRKLEDMASWIARGIHALFACFGFAPFSSPRSSLKASRRVKKFVTHCFRPNRAGSVTDCLPAMDGATRCNTRSPPR